MSAEAVALTVLSVVDLFVEYAKAIRARDAARAAMVTGELIRREEFEARQRAKIPKAPKP